MNRSLARSLPLTLALLLAALAVTPHAGADTASPHSWLGISGSTAYRSASLGSGEPTIYAQNLGTLRKTKIGTAKGYVSSLGDAASSFGVAVPSSTDTKTRLTIFRPGTRSIAVDSVAESECPPHVNATLTHQTLSAVELAPDGTLTYLKRGLLTGCEMWLVRRTPDGLTTRVWIPPTADQLINFTSVSAKGKMVLLHHSLGPSASILYEPDTGIIVPNPYRGAAHTSVELLTNDTIGTSVVGGKSSEATRLNWRTGRSRAFEFPREAEGHFCGRFTFFADGSLLKVYDETGHTRYRRAPRGVNAWRSPVLCSQKYVVFHGSKMDHVKTFVLSLTDFKSRKL